VDGTRLAKRAERRVRVGDEGGIARIEAHNRKT
jgi:hypothetical protein